MEMLLTREELWYVIDTPKPTVNSSQWEKDDKKARATMGLCIAESQYGLIKAATSAKDFWCNLKKYHEKVTVTSRVSMLKRLCNLNLLEDGDLECHLFEVEELFDRLTQAGQELAESLKVAMILRSLPESYSGLVTALEGRPDEDLTLELVKSKLLDEFERRKERSVQSSGEYPSEMKALKSLSNRNTSEWRCFRCKQKGHLKSDCPVQQEEKEQRSEHKKKKKSESSAAKQAAVNDRSAVLFLANEVRSCGWIIDSGASVHMCNDKRLFESIDDENVSDVVLADGRSVKAFGSGTVKMAGVNGCGGIVDVILEKALYVPSLNSGLLSVKMLTSKGFFVNFRKNGCDIVDAAGKVVVKGNRCGSLYKLKTVEQARKEDSKKQCVQYQASVAVRDPREPEEVERQEEDMSGKPSERVVLDDPDDGEDQDEPEEFYDASSSFPDDPPFEEELQDEAMFFKKSFPRVRGKFGVNCDVEGPIQEVRKKSVAVKSAGKKRKVPESSCTSKMAG